MKFKITPGLNPWAGRGAGFSLAGAAVALRAESRRQWRPSLPCKRVDPLGRVLATWEHSDPLWLGKNIPVMRTGRKTGNPKQGPDPHPPRVGF